MTKKDYVLIAQVFKDHYGVANNEQANAMFHSLKDRMIENLKKENPRFDEEKFLDYIEAV